MIDELSQRIRQANFFPTIKVEDMKLIVDEELSRLDPKAMPFLLKMLCDGLTDADVTTYTNAKRFVLGLARQSDADTTGLIARHILNKIASDDSVSMFVSELVSTDAKILLGMDPATKMRVRSLLLKNASEIKVGSYSFLKLRSPARNVAMMLHTLGEKDLLADYGGLVDAVVKFCPYEGEFIDLIRGSKKSSR